MSRIEVLPCLDSEEMAAARRRELDIDRARAQALGLSAVRAAEEGRYTTADGRIIDFGAAVRAAVEGKVSLPPEAALPKPEPSSRSVTRVQVTNQTTLAAGRRLVEQGRRPLALNFANGVYPGGGFLDGARAQEESLCRSSALYATLRGDPMYAAHAERPLPDSTSWTILSPAVPVFRDDAGNALAEPWELSFATCAAPVARAVGLDRAGRLLGARIHRVLAIAQAFGYDSLVLGAWGCGAFGCDPVRTAADFRDALAGPFAGAFDEAVFAITDWSPDRYFLGPFRDAFTHARD